MSKYYTDECVNCGLPCLGNGCPYHKVEHHRCDFCGRSDEQVEMTVFTEYEDICEDCHNRLFYEEQNKKEGE